MSDVLFKRHTKGLGWAEGASQVVLVVKNPPLHTAREAEPEIRRQEKDKDEVFCFVTKY